MKLTQLLSIIPFYETKSSIEMVNITDIEKDSRKVKQGNLFVCIEGFTVDGHEYVHEAEQKGAAAILAEREVDAHVPVIIVPNTSHVLAMLAVNFYGNPTKELGLTGVTGTNGKTTVTYLLEAIFQLNKENTGIIGTIQMKIGDKEFPINNTTPDALSLQRAFRRMADEGIEKGIMEVSSHALDLGRVYGCDFDIAVFTNLSPEHLDYHKDLDDYLRAKSLLFAQLGNSYEKDHPKFAVINTDDEASDLLKKSTAQSIITYGINKDAQVMAKDITVDVEGTSFTLQTPFQATHINSKMVGMFNVYNMLAASAAAIAAGVSLETIQSALSSIEGVNGRFEPVLCGQDYAVIVDYAHTPDSLENVLTTARGFAKQKVYVVVGTGGDRDRSKRPLMADIAMEYADYAIFTSDNPRTEDPQAILHDMTDHLSDSTDFEVITDRKHAIAQAISYAKTDDIILIAGKGHETYQMIGTEKYDFDDRKIAARAILG